MSLPNIPTTDEIYDRIISDIESKTSQTTPLFFKAFNIVLAKAVSGSLRYRLSFYLLYFPYLY